MMFNHARLKPEQDRRALQGTKTITKAACLTIAASLTLGFTTSAGAAPYNHHHRDRHHRAGGAAKHRAHKTDLGGYEFELIFEGPHALTADEEAGNRAAVEAVEHPGPTATPLEEETSTEPEG